VSLTFQVLRSAFDRPARRMQYGEHDHQNAELFLPAGDGPFPLVAVLHGGWWQARRTRSKLYLRPLAADLVGHGFAVLNAEYRRVGNGGGWPATFDDARAVVALAREQPEAARVAILGHSAGAQLALYAAAETDVDAVVTLAAPSDLEARPGPEVIGLMGGSPADVPERYAAGSPIRRVPLGVPVLLVHGTADDVVPPQRSRDFAAAARAAGDDVTLLEPGADHRQVVDPRNPAWAPVPAWLGERLS
jgi:dipeptidyl aminopeptidase/acylaminoacyl peptidase